MIGIKLRAIVNPNPSLLIVRFEMMRCSALHFCSQALIFLGNRQLLMTTVHSLAFQCRLGLHSNAISE